MPCAVNRSPVDVLSLHIYMQRIHLRMLREYSVAAVCDCVDVSFLSDSFLDRRVGRGESSIGSHLDITYGLPVSSIGEPTSVHAYKESRETLTVAYVDMCFIQIVSVFVY